MATVTPLTDVVSPASVDDLAELLGVDATDPLLPIMLESATDALENHLNSAIVSRQFKAYFEHWPYEGANTYGLSPNTAEIDCYVELPLTRLISVESVDVDGVIDTDYETRPTNPAQLHIDNHSGKLTVTYTAGFTDVPAAVSNAVLYAASYLYEHRGTCDATDALSKSGAADMVKRYVIERGF